MLPTKAFLQKWCTCFIFSNLWCLVDLLFEITESEYPLLQGIWGQISRQDPYTFPVLCTCSQIDLYKFLHLQFFFQCIIIFAKSGDFHTAGTSKDAVNAFHLCLKEKGRSGREQSLENKNESAPSPSCLVTAMKTVMLENLTFPPFYERWGVFFFESLPGCDCHLPARHTARLGGLDKRIIFIIPAKKLHHPRNTWWGIR